MNVAKCFCALPIVLALSGPVHAQEAFVGNWVLDPAASKAPPGMAPTGGTLAITDAGGGKYTSVSEATVGGVSGHSEITFAVDGKDYVITSTPAQPGAEVTQSIERVSDTAYKASVKVNGELIATALTELSSDRTTLTQTTTGLGQFAGLSGTMVFKRN